MRETDRQIDRQRQTGRPTETVRETPKEIDRETERDNFLTCVLQYIAGKVSIVIIILDKPTIHCPLKSR